MGSCLRLRGEKKSQGFTVEDCIGVANMLFSSACATTSGSVSIRRTLSEGRAESPSAAALGSAILRVMNTPQKTENIWQCVGHNPTEWALGTQIGNEMTEIRAWTRRQKDGSWRWEAPPAHGTSPSREEAIEAASASLQNAEVSDRSS